MLHENTLNRCFFYSFETRWRSGAGSRPGLKKIVKEKIWGDPVGWPSKTRSKNRLRPVNFCFVISFWFKKKNRIDPGDPVKTRNPDLGPVRVKKLWFFQLSSQRKKFCPWKGLIVNQNLLNLKSLLVELWLSRKLMEYIRLLKYLLLHSASLIAFVSHFWNLILSKVKL